MQFPLSTETANLCEIMKNQFKQEKTEKKTSLMNFSLFLMLSKPIFAS